MSTIHAKELKKIQKVIYRGKYNQALEKLSLLLEQEGLSDEDSVKGKIVHSRVLKLVNKHNDAINFIEKLLKNKIVKKDPLLKIEVTILKSDILLLMGRESNALTFINQVDEMIENYKKKNKNDGSKRLEAYHNFVKGNAFLKRGHTKEALHQMKISLDLWKELDNKQEIARVLRNIGKCHIERAEFDTAIVHLEESYKISMSIRNMMDSIHPLTYLADLYYKKGKIDKTIEYYKKRLILSEKAKFKYGILSSNFFLGFCYVTQSEMKKAEKYLKVSLKMSEELEHYRMLGLSLSTYGLYYKLTGEFEKAIKYYNKGIKAYEKIDYKHGVAESLNNMGEIQLAKGNSSKALEIYKRSLLIFEEIGKPTWIINTQRSIGDVYAVLGDLDEALRYYFKALDYYLRKSYKIQVSQCMYNIGGIYWRKDDLEAAKKYFNDSLGLIKEFGNDIITAKILLDLISINLDTFEIPIASKHFLELHDIDLKFKNKLINQQTRFAEALLYMNSEEEKKHGKAELILEQLVEEKVIHLDLTVKALLSLCESYLDDLNTPSRKDTIINLNRLVERLLGIADEQQAVSLLAETYWLKYRLLIVDDKTEQEAEIYLEKADHITKEFELTNLAKKFSIEKNLIEFQLKEDAERYDPEDPTTQKRDVHRELMAQIVIMKNTPSGLGPKKVKIYEEDQTIYTFSM